MPIHIYLHTISNHYIWFLHVVRLLLYHYYLYLYLHYLFTSLLLYIYTYYMWLLSICILSYYLLLLLIYFITLSLLTYIKICLLLDPIMIFWSIMFIIVASYCHLYYLFNIHYYIKIYIITLLFYIYLYIGQISCIRVPYQSYHCIVLLPSRW
jgi:hypothetical protein